MDETDTFNILRYKRFGIHPDFDTGTPYIHWVDDNGRLHRVCGPAIELPNAKYWFLNGSLGRSIGPVIEYTNGIKYWYLNGRLFGEQDFKEELKRLSEQAA